MTLLVSSAITASLVSIGCATSDPHKIDQHAQQEFVGSVPCDPAVMNFVGGLPTNAPCHCITWKLTFVRTDGPSERRLFNLVATYGLPGQNDPNQLEEGPTINVKGQWEVLHGTKEKPTGIVYRISTGDTNKAISFLRIGGSLLHFLNDDQSLKVGNAGWSFTLNRKPINTADSRP
jgi:hypothetical protein